VAWQGTSWRRWFRVSDAEEDGSQRQEVLKDIRRERRRSEREGEERERDRVFPFFGSRRQMPCTRTKQMVRADLLQMSGDGSGYKNIFLET
jgi:hypothetical protein